MKCIKITHPNLKITNLDQEAEYYFCHFASDKDIKDFTATCSWFNAEDLGVEKEESWVIKYIPQSGEVYKIDPVYFKRDIGKKLEVWGSVLEQARAFF